jgi:SLIDE
LQAQDRCHRLGQKKPVNVFRLVSENTVEEKIVERAQQKLKLDAMVVQQGRLKEKDKVTKEEIMAAVRFGADTIFRSDESTVTDEDIDVILERGMQKTKELNAKLQAADKGDLLDFRLDGGISAQTFEGVDYSDRNLREHLRMLAASQSSKRERKPPPSGYQPIIHAKKSMVVNNLRIKLPKVLRLPQMEDHHFYNRERLLELGELEFQNYAALRESNSVPPKEVLERLKSLLPPELAQEKRELMAEGFGNWSRGHLYSFVKACAKYGRDDFAKIAADMDKQEEDVEAYSESFWKYGSLELKNEWERIVATITKGEKKLEKQKKASELLKKFISTFEDPRNDMVFANKGTTHFSLEQDRALLFAVYKHGYGNWDQIREEIRTDSRLKFQHSTQGMTAQAIAKRCDYRMRQLEKELEAREKTIRNKRPPAVIAAQRAIEAIKEMDLWDRQVTSDLLDGLEPQSIKTLSTDAQQIMIERIKDRDLNIYRLREIEVQVQRALAAAEETRQEIYRGAQYVNYSNVTLKPTSTGGPTPEKNAKPGMSIVDGIELEAKINAQILKVKACGRCYRCVDSKLCVNRMDVRKRLLAEASSGDKRKTKKRKADIPPPPPRIRAQNVKATAAPKEKKVLLMKRPDGQIRPRVTSQGNKRMTIPEEVFPEFCRRIGAQGTGERMNLITQFVVDHPTISVRQVTMRLSEITVRQKPECVIESEKSKKAGRAFMFYLRPCFYKCLPASERPKGWEKYAAEDAIKYQEDQEKRKRARAAKNAANGLNSDAGSDDGQRSDGTDNDDEDEETGERSTKRRKPDDDGTNDDENDDDVKRDDDDGSNADDNSD